MGSTHIAVIVSGLRWDELSRSLQAEGIAPGGLSLAGLATTVALEIGARLGRTLDQLEVEPRVFCRAQPVAADADAVASGFAVVSAPQVDENDVGAGISLEAIRVHAQREPEALVVVGGAMTWQPLARRLESLGCELFEFVIPPPGKVVVTHERILDLRSTLREKATDQRFAPMIAARPAGRSGAAPAPSAPAAAAGPATAVFGRVKSLAAGYGVVTRGDGGGDVEFMAPQVAPPGFEFLEVGDTLRFDVVRLPSGKWQAVRVVRS